MRRPLALLALALALVAAPALATVSTTSTQVAYTGDGAITAFPVPFPFIASTDLVVTRTLAGTTTTLVLGVDYTVTGGHDAAGTVNLTSAPLTGSTLTIDRDAQPLVQPTAFPTQGPFLPKALEQGLDSLTLLLQQLSGSVATTADLAALQAAVAALQDEINALSNPSGNATWVTSYGAKGDCVTDDSAAFTAALAASKTVYVPDPAFCYLLKATVTVPADHRLVGFNKRSTKLQLGANVDMLVLQDGAGLSNLYLEGAGGTYSGRGVYLTNANGRQSVDHVRVVNFAPPAGFGAIEFWPMAGSQSSWHDIEAWQTGGASPSTAYGVVVGSAISGAADAGSTAGTLYASLADTVHPSGYYNSMNVQFTSGVNNAKLKTVTSSLTNGSGSWTFVLGNGTGGSDTLSAPGVGDTFHVITNSAVPRKFTQFESGGNASFDFGTCNDFFVGGGGYLADLNFTTQSRAVLITGMRLGGSTATTAVKGFNIAITGSDIGPQVVVDAAANPVTVVGNTYNNPPILDNSTNSATNILDNLLSGTVRGDNGATHNIVLQNNGASAQLQLKNNAGTKVFTLSEGGGAGQLQLANNTNTSLEITAPSDVPRFYGGGTAGGFLFYGTQPAAGTGTSGAFRLRNNDTDNTTFFQVDASGNVSIPVGTLTAGATALGNLSAAATGVTSLTSSGAVSGTAFKLGTQYAPVTNDAAQYVIDHGRVTIGGGGTATATFAAPFTGGATCVCNDYTANNPVHCVGDAAPANGVGFSGTPGDAVDWICMGIK